MAMTSHVSQILLRGSVPERLKPKRDIEKQDFILTPGRYVGIAEVEEDGEPFHEKMERLTSELSDLFAQSHTLEDEIRKQLVKIGFTIK